jgi:peroxiredoxin
MKFSHMTALAPMAALLLLVTGCTSESGGSAGKTPAAHSASKPVEQAAAPTKAELGKPAPAFVLKDLDGKEHSLAQYKGKIVVLEWFSATCPTCKWAYSTGPLVDMPERLMKDGIVWLGINSDAPENAAAKPETNRAFVDKYKMQAPILFDPTGTVGRSYGAKSTPHMFVIDAKGTLVYMGGLDNAPGGNVTGEGARIDYVGDAIADVKAGRAVKTAETKSYG